MRGRPVGGLGVRLARVVFPIAAAAIVLAGCDDDDEPFAPGLDVDAVVGFYDPATLTFDPLGSLPVVHIAERLDPGVPPQLNLARDGTFQIVFRYLSTGRFEVIDGEFTTLPDGVRLEFGSEADAQRLLLPQRVELAFNASTGSLSFVGEVDVPLDRLLELAPEFEDEQLRDPVRGELTMIFTRQEEDAGE
ncbi:MAG TPA: hypothetical protein VF188_14445 [Longimicrobiales bacterium]